MSAEAHDHDHGHDHEHEHHHKETFITKYIFSIDHKMIAKQYLITGIIMGIIGIAMSLLFRIQIAWPEESFKVFSWLLGDDFAPGGVMRNDIYLALVTIHGTIMVFFVLTAGLSGTFSNLLIPLQIGARDMASGFMNMISYWLFFLSSVIMVISLFVESGPASAGWTIYPPLSALPQAMSGSGAGMTLWLVSMAIFIASSLLGSLNYIITVINLRTKGMKMTRLPLSIWAFLVTAILGVLSFPVLFSCALLLIFDRSFNTSFYLSDIYIGGRPLDHVGGSPILFEHLFWFLGHPEVYIVLLPALGITSEVISTNSRKPIFGYKAMVGSMFVITILSFVVWAHHMFVTGMNPFLGTIFTLLTLIIAVPSAVKVFNYVTTLWKGNIRFTPAMLFSIGLVSFFLTGGITGLFLGNSAIDIQLHDTYFVVAHFHIVMGSASFFGMLAGIYHWFPKMFGKMMDARLGSIHFWCTFIGIYLVFFPMHYLGIAGFPRRYYSWTSFQTFEGFVDLNMLISAAAFVTFAAQFVFLFNFIYSIKFGRKAPANPWNSNTLEWTTPRHPKHGNWPGRIPPVYRWPYDYSKPGAAEDFIPQHIPLSDTPESNLTHEKELALQEASLMEEYENTLKNQEEHSH